MPGTSFEKFAYILTKKIMPFDIVIILKISFSKTSIEKRVSFAD